MDEDRSLMRACVGNGWFAVRPSLSKGCFERLLEQDWAQSKEWSKPLKLGNHRMKPEWLDERFSHFDEHMKIKHFDWEIFNEKKKEKVLVGQTDESYHGPEGCKHFLEALDALDISEEDKTEPWFELVVSNFDGEGMEAYREALRTPAELRKLAGVDEHLGSQKPKPKDKKKKEKALQARQLKTITIEKMRKLKSQGYTLDQIAKACIVPHVGKPKPKGKLAGRGKGKG